MSDQSFEPVIGLEIHVELKTLSKMFCGCPADWFGKAPNSVCCPVCLGLPGALPVPNRKAVEWCVKLGMALECEIPVFSKFDRKHYFYPDLPKGYQISQYDKPFANNGKLVYISGSEEKTVRIRRVHMEEDTGKLIHAAVDGKDYTLVDFNRSGVPLVEIVTEPDITSGDDAKEFLKALYQLIRFLDISDADMEKGSMRLEPNISVRKRGDTTLPSYKVEVKNINSFTFVKRAIEYETKRHIDIVTEGNTPMQETRGWNEDKGVTISQRTKEEAHDYRYFPEPDIPPVVWNEATLAHIRKEIPELPLSYIKRLRDAYGLSMTDARILTQDRARAFYFETVVAKAAADPQYTTISAQKIANWMIHKNQTDTNIPPEKLLLTIKDATQTIDIALTDLQAIIHEVLETEKQAVAQYKSGKTTVIMFLVGSVMRKLKGKGNAMQIRAQLEKTLQ